MSTVPPPTTTALAVTNHTTASSAPSTDIPAAPPPPPAPTIFMKGTELFRAVETPVGNVYLPIIKPPEPPPLMLNRLHKIPLTLYRQMLGFLLWTQEAFAAEGLIYAFHHPEHGWHAEPPEQTTHGMTVSADDTELETLMAPKGYTLRFTAHHHCTSSAFQSGTDKTDEHSKPSGLHITLGELNKPTLAFHGRIVVRVGQNTHQFDINLHEFGKHIAFDNLAPEFAPFEHLLYPIIVNPGSAMDFPSEWKERIKRPKPTTPAFQAGSSPTTSTTRTQTTRGGTTTATRMIMINMGPIDSKVDIERLREITQDKPLGQFIHKVATMDSHGYDFRCALTLLCMMYPGQNVIRALEIHNSCEYRFSSEAVLDQYLLLHQFHHMTYDISGDKVSVLTQAHAHELEKLKGAFTIVVKTFQQYATSNPITQALALLEAAAKAPLPPPPTPKLVPVDDCAVIIDQLPTAFYYPPHLKKAIQGLTVNDLCRAFLTVPQAQERDLLLLLCNHYALPYLISTLEKEGIPIIFGCERFELVYHCLALGDDWTCIYRKNTIYTADPSMLARMTHLIANNKSQIKLAVKNTTAAAITAQRKPLPTHTLELLEQALDYNAATAR